MKDDLRGKPVRSLQTMLRTISAQIPQIPPVVPDGIYGDDTMRSVMALQNYVRLPVTGITDIATWNETVALYEILDENFSPPESLALNLSPGQILTPGDGNLHFILIDAIFQSLSLIFDNIPPESASGLHILQELSGLDTTGKLDRITWRYLVGLYRLALFDGIVR